MHLPDINVWLALNCINHPHHSSAMAWYRRHYPDGCAFCRMTQQGYLRLATHPKAAGPDVMSLPDAWRSYDQMLANPGIVFIVESGSTEALWRSITDHPTATHTVWNDAWLAAVAMALGLNIVSFDQGFHQFAGLSFTHLRP